MLGQGPSQRFWPKTSFGSGCWEWQASLLNTGYGSFRFNGKTQSAHRVAWQLFYEQPVPPELSVLHRCDNPKCVRPTHLKLGTHLENMAEMRRKGRQAQGARVVFAKLTAEKVQQIRELSQCGLSHRQLAANFGVSADTIGLIVRGVTWKAA